MNMSSENKAHFEAEKKTIHLILTGIGDEIYSTIDAFQTAQEMWEAIERKPKRVKHSAYHKEKMFLCKQAKQEVNEKELEAHYSYMAKIKKVPTVDTGTNSEPVEQNDQNDVESDDEHVVLANLIANLKLDNEKESNVFQKEREQYFEIQDLKAQLQDKKIAISELKKLSEKSKGKSMDTKFDKPSVVQQPNAQRIPKPSVLGKPAPFSNSLERIYFSKTKSVLKTNVSEVLSKPVTAQTLPQTARQAFAPILRYGYLVQGNVMINKVYNLEGLNHNLFSVGQFCDANLEVAFKKSTCFVRDLQGNDLLIDVHVPSQQELDLLFGPLYDEVFNAGSNPQDKQPTMNIQPTSAPSTPTYVHAEENNDNQAKEDHITDDEFTNTFCAPAQEVTESSSHNIEHVHGNPSRLVQTRRQLATDPEMCMFALTVSTVELKNIKEAMADSAWIEAMQEELHQFDRLQ
nr:Gag-Pol polyprotein [Tanacetum cinerariifolium]